MIGRDPTSTLTLRSKAISQINRRFNIIKRIIKETLIDNKVLSNAEAATKGRFIFLRDAEKVEEFSNWLHKQIETEILSKSQSGAVDIKNHWLNRFIGSSYGRGANKTRNILGRQFDIPQSSVFANPSHVERAELLYTRTFSQLKGITEVMEQQIARVLTDGVIQGKGIKVIAKELNDRVDKIGKTRSRLLARTEIVNAHNVASIKEAENLEGVLGEEVQMKWQTALDGRERDSHRARHGKKYDKDVALNLLGEPNCRCSVTPWLEAFENEASKDIVKPKIVDPSDGLDPKQIESIKGYTAKGGADAGDNPFGATQLKTLKDAVDNSANTEYATLYRGMSLSDKEIQNIVENGLWDIDETVTYKGLQSFSRDKNRRGTFAGGGENGVYLEVKGKSFLDLQKHSLYGEEQEVLFNNLKIKWTKDWDYIGGRYYLYGEEIID